MAATCNICGKSFTRTDNLKRHLKVHADNDHSNKCSVCGKQHIQSLRDIYHQCTVMGNLTLCVKFIDMYLHRNSLWHLKNHQEFYIYCQVYGKYVKRKDIFKRHSIRHNKEVVFTCQCGENFKCHNDSQVCSGRTQVEHCWKRRLQCQLGLQLYDKSSRVKYVIKNF